LSAPGRFEFCACEHRDPLVKCGVCGVICPAEARFCRGCRAALSLPAVPDGRTLTEAPAAEFLFVPGVFHVPPVIRQRYLWCMSADGQVSRLSLAAGAKPRTWAKIGSKAAGFNRPAIAEASFSKGSTPRPLFLTIDPDGIRSLPLAEHQAGVLYRPPAGQEIVANASANQSINFRGLAVSSDAYAFLQRQSGASEAVLTIRYFAEGRAGEQPLRVSGVSFLGPVMENGVAAVCGEEEVWLYRMAEQTCESFEFKNFKPLFARSSPALNVPPGGMPLWAGIGERGLEVRIAGARAGFMGWLRIFPEKHYDEFAPLPIGSCISRAEPAGSCVNVLDTIEFLGVDRPPGRYGDLEPRMPVGYVKPNLAYFDRTQSSDSHQLTVFAGVPFSVSFDDRSCHADSCCGLSFAGDSLVVSYLLPSGPKSAQGLKVVYWRLSK
jgi:hypothetical protein